MGKEQVGVRSNRPADSGTGVNNEVHRGDLGAADLQGEGALCQAGSEDSGLSALQRFRTVQAKTESRHHMARTTGHSRRRCRRGSRGRQLAWVAILAASVVLCVVAVQVLRSTGPSAPRASVVDVVQSRTAAPVSPATQPSALTADPSVPVQDSTDPTATSATSASGTGSASASESATGKSAPTSAHPSTSTGAPGPSTPASATATTAPTSAPTSNPPAPVGSSNSSVLSVGTETEGDGQPAALNSGVLTSAIGPSGSPDSHSVSVMKLRPTTAPKSGKWTSGQHMRLSYDVDVSLGASAQQSSSWHGLTYAWGLGGSADSPTYPSAAWTLGISEGQWTFDGGEWDNEQNWGNYELMPYVDNTRWHVVIDVVYSASAQRSIMNVSINGKQVVANLHQPSILPSNWDGVTVFVGLTYGQDRGATAPTNRRSAVYSNVVMARV